MAIIHNTTMSPSKLELLRAGGAQGDQETLNEILVGGNFYLRVTANGHSLPGAPGGRRWVEIPVGHS